MFKQKPLKRVVLKRGSFRQKAGVFTLVSALLTVGLFVVFTGSTFAATNSTINFQARLEGAAGNIAPDGNYNVQFKLYNAASGGSALWTETYQNSNSQGIAVKNGYLTTNLGSITAFPNTINWDQDLWITLNVGGTSTGASPTYDGEMNPRLHLTSVPYAFRAGQLAQFNSSTGFTSTLSLLQPTVGNQAFQVADQAAAGTYTLCVQGATAAKGGCAPTTGGSGYIQNQNGSTQTANFKISGTGIAGTLQAAAFDTASAGTLAIGNTNATTINIGTVSAARTINLGNANASTTIQLQAATGTYALNTSGVSVFTQTSTSNNIATFTNSGNTRTTTINQWGDINVDPSSAIYTNNLKGYSNTDLNIYSQGTGNIGLQTYSASSGVLVKSNTNSATALQIQNSSGTSFFTANSSLQAITTKDMNVGSLATSTASRLFSDGFESNNFSLWDQGVNYSGSSTLAIDKATVRNGNYSAKVANTTSGHAYALAYFNGVGSAVIRAYVNVSSQSTTGTAELFALTNVNGTAFRVVRDQATGKLGFYNGVTSTTTLSSTALPTGAWHEIELSVGINATTGSATIYLDGTSIQSLTSQNTGSSNINYAVIGNAVDNQAITFNVDDLSVDTLRPGDSSNLSVADSLHVSGTSTFNSTVVVQGGSTQTFMVQDPSGTGLLAVDGASDVVRIDPNGNGSGTLSEGLSFGGTTSEGIASDRWDSSGNKHGLDFYTNNTHVFQLFNNGAALFKNGTDSTTAFQIQNAADTTLLSADTTNGTINISGPANSMAMTVGDGTSANTLAFNPGMWWNPATGAMVTGSGYFNFDLPGTGTLDISDNLLVSPGTTTSAFQVQNASGGSLLNVDATNSVVTIGGKTDIGVAAGSPYELDVANNIHICGNGSNCGNGQLFFGDNAVQYGSSNSDNNNPWIGETNGDSDILMMSGSAGIEFQTSYTSDTYHYQSFYNEAGDFCIDTTSCSHHLGVNGSAAASSGFATGTPDIAEYITTAPDVSAYDVVAADPNNSEAVVKATGSMRSSMVGVISDGTSGFMMQNAHYGQAYDINTQTADQNAKPMTLAGRIPVHVTNENGAIHPGDYLTVSATMPGYAMKATTAGPTIGKALGFFDGSSGTVLTLINLSYYNPLDGNHIQSQSGSFDTLQAGSASFSSLNVSGPTTLASLTVNGDASFQANLTVAGTLTAASIVVNGHIVTAGQAPTITIGTAAGQAKSINGTLDPSTEPTAAVDGTDSAGTVSLITGANSLAGGVLAHVVFSQTFSGAYKVVMSADNDTSSRLHVYIAKTSTGFDVVTDDIAAATTEYQFDYVVMGTGN